MQYRSFLLAVIILVFCQPLLAQSQLPRNYFRNPMGIPMQLSANFGELRPNHWHMGLDIRTNQKENLPVYATAEGYISHIGIRPSSFGRFIIINHPNGLSTLYAHLNDFYPELEAFVTEQQYKKETWAIEIDLTSTEFPVKKGTLIAYSGNTGGSQGPHLHFEIFDTQSGNRLNPLLFNFPFADAVPPELFRLAIYDRSRSTQEQTPKLFSLKKTDSGYIIPKVPVLKTGYNKISFAIQAIDKVSGGGSPNGIFSAELIHNGNPRIKFVIDSIPYEETLYMNAHIDFKHDHNGGVYLQHLSQLPGDRGKVYKKLNGDGVISLSDTSIQDIVIEVKDAYGNASVLKFGVQYNDSMASLSKAVVHDEKFVPGIRNWFQREDFIMAIPGEAIYDTIPKIYARQPSTASQSVTAAHRLNDDSYPVHGNVQVQIKPTKDIPAEWRDKIIIQRTGKGSNLRKASWKDGWLTANFSDFGTFQAYVDITPPSINDPGKGDTINLSSATRILFTPRDNMGAITRFRAELNGQWLRFTNDKGRNWIYKFDERCPYGKHELKVTIEDLAGNVTTKTWWFERKPYTPPVKKKTSGKKKNIKTKKKR